MEATDSGAQERQAMEEYLTVQELSARIKFSRQTLYNLIHKGTFVIGKHYLKPSPKKILFIWSEIHEWMKEPSCSDQIQSPNPSDQSPNSINSDQDKPKSSINI